MARRRARGEGSIFQRSDGLWVGRVDLGWVGGRRVRRQVTARTLKDLRPKLKALKDEVELGIVSADRTVGQWLTYWIERGLGPDDVKARTRTTYRGYIETWLIPELGKVKLRNLRTEHVRTMHEHMREAGKSAATIRQAHMILRGALKQAVYDRHIATNPAELVKAPMAGDGTHGVLTREEVRALLDLLSAYGDDGEWWVTSRFLVAIVLGLRQGEALGLRWEDVDLTPGAELIRLRRQIQRQAGVGLVEAPLKSSSRVGEGRDVPLLTPVAHALREHRATADAGYVWGGAKPTDPRRDWGVWKGLLWSADVRGHPLHAARATAASVLGEANVPLKTIAAILGHSQITTAWTHYVHSDERQNREGLAAGWRSLGWGADADH